jgi:nucleotide-binding universal stress UspA family protein
MFDRILVPLDGSEVAEGILPFVTAIAKGTEATVTLLAVIDTTSMEVARARAEAQSSMAPGSLFVTSTRPQPIVDTYRTQSEEAAEEEAKTALRVIAKRLADQGVEARVEASSGPVAEEILRVAKKGRCDLIAMSTHGRGAIARAILGSVTDKVIHSSNVPTLTITPERAETYWDDDVVLSKILVPLDGSGLAETALPYVEDLARSLSLEVILARVVKLVGLSTPHSDPSIIGTGDLELEIEREAADYLEEVASRLEANGLDASYKLLRGATAKAITQLAQDTPQDIIALTTHGRSGLTRWVLGSVAEALVRASGDPVLVIPPED